MSSDDGGAQTLPVAHQPCRLQQGAIAQRTINAMICRAFVVEDNATIRENLIEILAELAHVQSVGEAETERDARQRLHSSVEWDVTIVDLFLREGSGLNVVAACRTRQPGQRVVVLSNHATEDMRRRCLALGADAVFDKSTEIGALMDHCARAAVEAA